MRNALPLLIILIVATFALGCQSTPKQPPADPAAASSPDATQGKLAAYIDGQAVTQTQLYQIIIQAHGGEALAQLLLDRAVQARLKQENIKLGKDDINAEQAQLLATLSPDPDQAARLLQDMRTDRGLDPQRFNAMLQRNAGLRALVRDKITISDASIEQAYQLRFGKRYQARLITTNQLDPLTQARRQAIDGASFTDLAIERSTDASTRQGGLLSPISPADPTYPKAIRDALPKLTMTDRASRLSPVIALPEGYALLWLEEVLIDADAPPIEQVRAELKTAVRAELERVRMRQLARTLIDKANVVVLDPVLNKAWQRQLESIRNP